MICVYCVHEGNTQNIHLYTTVHIYIGCHNNIMHIYMAMYSESLSPSLHICKMQMHTHSLLPTVYWPLPMVLHFAFPVQWYIISVHGDNHGASTLSAPFIGHWHAHSLRIFALALSCSRNVLLCHLLVPLDCLLHLGLRNTSHEGGDFEQDIYYSRCLFVDRALTLTRGDVSP